MRSKAIEGKITFGGMKTENGRLYAFISDGDFPDDILVEKYYTSSLYKRKERKRKK